jgi:ketosteroid isomerase-like protein
MSAATENREIITTAMAGMAKGDTAAFWDAWAEDGVWRMMGSRRWGIAYPGRVAARDQLFAPLRKQFADTFINTATNILADGDYVVVEILGAVALKAGGRYENRYCFVIRMAGGKMAEVREYFDTALADRLLEPIEP